MDELGMGHRFLDRLHGSDHELQKIDLPTMKTALLRAGDKKLAAALDDVAVLDSSGCVLIRETAFKAARREFYKNLPAAAPRGSGPAPRPPEAQPRFEDHGNRQEPPKPVMTSDGSVHQAGVHNPEFAMRLLQAIIDNQRRAMRRR